MEEETIIDANIDLITTHFFLYKGKKYPFNMKLFKCYSQYFQENKSLFKDTQIIDLIEETEHNLDYSELSINDFINFCQSKKISLNKENVIFLHKLAKKYKVPSLITHTSKFISAHQKDVVIDLLILSQNEKDSNNQEYEEIISNIFPEYLKDSRLLLLSLPVLHRIVAKYTHKNINPEKRSEFIEFLFKCLDHFGRNGSVLFEHIDIGCYGGTFVHRLLNEYSGKFDFHFINNEKLRTIYDLESEIIERTNKLREAEIASKSSIDVLNRKLSEMEAAIEETNRNKDSQIHQLQEKLFVLETENKELRRTIDEIKRNRDPQIQHLESTLESKLSVMRLQIEQLNEKMAQQNVLKNQLHPTKKSFMFSSDSNPKGVISSLGDSVTLSHGGSSCSSYPLENIRQYDNEHFFNSSNYTTSSESDSYIKFDFGPLKKIDLYSYFIRSNLGNASPSYSHPKTWRIEGSNDDSHWFLIDRRENDANLCGPYKQHHFICQESNHGDENLRYRYIRYVQEISWSNSNYNVYITFFELYGDVFENY